MNLLDWLRRKLRRVAALQPKKAKDGGTGGNVPAGNRSRGPARAVQNSPKKKKGSQSRFTKGDLRKLVEIALGEVGVKEEGGNNRGARIREYQAATWLKPAAWPWCAAFVCWVIREWQTQNPHLPKFKRPRTAGAFDFERWAREQGFQVLPEISNAKVGDLVVFDFSHIGIVTKDQTGTCIQTVEGNTNIQGQRDSRSGDGVWKKERYFKLAKSYIRFC